MLRTSSEVDSLSSVRHAISHVIRSTAPLMAGTWIYNAAIGRNIVFSSTVVHVFKIMWMIGENYLDYTESYNVLQDQLQPACCVTPKSRRRRRVSK